jgi:hypothetical protein
MPTVPVATPMLRPIAEGLARRVARFGRTVEGIIMAKRESVLDRQYIQERIADAAIGLYTAACTLSRLDWSRSRNRATPADQFAAELYMRMASRRFDQSLAALRSHDDQLTTRTAHAALRAITDYQPPA